MVRIHQMTERNVPGILSLRDPLPSKLFRSSSKNGILTRYQNRICPLFTLWILTSPRQMCGTQMRQANYINVSAQTWQALDSNASMAKAAIILRTHLPHLATQEQFSRSSRIVKSTSAAHIAGLDLLLTSCLKEKIVLVVWTRPECQSFHLLICQARFTHSNPSYSQYPMMQVYGA